MRTAWLLALVLVLACSTVRHSGTADGISSSPTTVTGGSPEERAVEVLASICLEREDPEAGPPRAEALARAQGGHLQQSSRESATVRVPADHLDPFLTALGTLGRVQEKDVRRDDVTEARQDLQIRLDNLRRARERYLALLEKASNVAETVTVEHELERVTTEYEMLQARLKAMEGAIALATVRIDFARPVRPGPIGWVFEGLYLGVKWLFVWD